MVTPLATIVVVPREKFSRSKPSLDSIYRNTEQPFNLVYVDGNSPTYVRDYLCRAAREKGFELIRVDRFLSPNEARNIGYARVTTRYVVFVDNDLEVEPGWLTHLVDCAEETGAGAVSPVYFEGSPRDRIIHMCGGVAEIEEINGIRDFHEDHLFKGRRYSEVHSELRRTRTGSFEFHCVLMRVEVLEGLGPFDEGYPSNHDHIDVSLLLRESGHPIWIAPGAQVTYTHGLLNPTDLEYVDVRWSEENIHRSAWHFVTKWNIDKNSKWIEATIAWGNTHRQRLHRMRRSPLNQVRFVQRRLVARTKGYAAANPMTRRMFMALRDIISR